MSSSLIMKLFYAVIGLLILIGAATMFLRMRNLTFSEFKRAILRRRPLKLWMFLLAVVFAGAFSVFYWADASNSATALITLNYAEASKAENANGTRYNMAEIICPEVLERAIKKGAFENVTADDLQACVSVEPLVQGNAYDENNYHIATEYVLSYTASKDTAHLDAENVVKLIADAYKEFYIDHYADNFSVLELPDDPDFSEMDYLDTVAYLQVQASRVMNYMYGMADRNSSFVSSSGDTFNSVAARVYQINEVQIGENLRSYILHNGISRDVKSYIGRLDYENKLLDYDYQKADASYAVRNEAVDMYAEEMTRIVLVPTWDQDGTYYMGRTKVGVDELSVEAEEYSQAAAGYLERIENNKTVISAMEKAKESGSDAGADKMIVEIYDTIRSFARLARATGQEYSETRMNQCVTAVIYGPPLTRCLLACVLIAVVFYGALLFLMAARQLPGTKKEGVYVETRGSGQEQETADLAR